MVVGQCGQSARHAARGWATPDGGYRLDGVKGFCSGTRGSQRMTVSAHDPDTGRTVFGVVPTDRAGITVNEDWDPIGQRQTDSGSVRFDGVTLAADEVLHRSETPPTRARRCARSCRSSC